jgi:hypothetical protein
VPEILVTQLLPFSEVRIVPASPTATKLVFPAMTMPNVMALRLFPVGSGLRAVQVSSGPAPMQNGAIASAPAIATGRNRFKLVLRCLSENAGCSHRSVPIATQAG